jgi:hypothetical protein
MILVEAMPVEDTTSVKAALAVNLFINKRKNKLLSITCSAYLMSLETLSARVDVALRTKSWLKTQLFMNGLNDQ